MPLRQFPGHKGGVNAVAIFPDKRRMVTGSEDKTLRLWDLKTGVVLKHMEGHRSGVLRLAVSRDGQLISSGGEDGEVIVWHGETGKPLTQPIEAHSKGITSLDFSPDGTVLITGSSCDRMMKLWNTKTWEQQGNPIQCGRNVNCMRYSPSGEFLAVATYDNVEIYNSSTRERVASFKAHTELALSLAWTPDGTRLLTGGSSGDATMREWDTTTWKQVGDPWTGHTSQINAIAIHPAGKLVASASGDRHIRLWQLSDGHTITIFKHSWTQHSWTQCITFSVDGNRILSGGYDRIISEWAVPHNIHLKACFPPDSYSTIRTYLVQIISITAAHDACIEGDLSTAEALLTQDIDTNPNNHISYAHRSFVLARKRNWYLALRDAIKVRFTDPSFPPYIQPSLTGYISKGIALCGNGRVPDARAAFDVASMYTDRDPQILHLLLLIKAIALFNANQQEEANVLLKELAAGCPNADTLACLVVQAYLRVQLGLKALDDARHEEAADYFTAALDSGALSSKVKDLTVRVASPVFHGITLEDSTQNQENKKISSKPDIHEASTQKQENEKISSKPDIHEIYEDFVVLVQLFGWDLKSLRLTAHQKRCHALFQAGKLPDAVKSFRYMMYNIDEATKASCLEWSNSKSGVCNVMQATGLTPFHSAFTEVCGTLCLTNGDTALAAHRYDRAYDLYSAAIYLGSVSDVVFANRSRAKLGQMLWEDALLDAHKVTELNPSSHVGYQLTHTALRGAERYDEAINAFKIMLSKLDESPDPQIRDLRQQYVCPSEVEDAIQRAVWVELECVPLRLINTSTGRLCDRAAQLNSFKTSVQYKEFLSFTPKHSDLQMDRIKNVVAKYFRCVLLSHRWEETEVLLHDIQNKDVRELKGFDGITKLQSFCKVARNAGYRWAWMDTCCIDKKSNTEVQESVNSMFVWYRHSALTIVYLCDVPPSSQPGALAKSVWNKRGWTFPEFVAPKVVIFYQKDWSLYLNDRSPNHKESPAIMKELEDATGIDARALVTFRPGLRGAREKLQWTSKRVTTVQEDVAYSLFGIFGITLPVIYGEMKQNALGRLLQEIVARSGDITVLDWIGQPSEFNSCLPAHVTSYSTPPRALSSLSEDHIHTQVTSLRQTVPTDLALKFYDQLEQLRAPRFANCRLDLPCMSFRVTEVRRRRGLAQGPPITYAIKADGLHDLLITTEETLVQFSREKPIQQTFLLVRPWDRRLLGVPDFAEQPKFEDDTESIGPELGSPMVDSQMNDFDKLPSGSPVDEEERALRLLVCIGQPFDAFLLAQQRAREYKRIASDHNIIAEVKNIASVNNMNTGTVEIV
ncbi:uncharacterized protein EDB93DRAFT_1252134 [Suillus bovinus]|uniref:uncharacterized protein n=1 Tax=Suillus bovinus TaxID=48563 RepID=UPI001B87B3B8|nr:uncharacterized protein EDB93DRAFT_1252134 [Suillus bovinus]KAG2142871.1 hypothetical protein EDB93DRAFT_1252134 [Suillus bovinus]